MINERVKHYSERRKTLITQGLLNTHPIYVAHAQGHTIVDVNGKSYTDLTSGIGVTNLGHGHPKIMNALQTQAEAFIHTCFQVCMYDSYMTLAEALHQRIPGEFNKKTFLVTTGTEAVEGAVKFARAYTQRQAVLSFHYAFHGRTFYALQLTGRATPYRSGFGLGSEHVYHFPFPNPYRAKELGLSADDLSGACLDSLERLFITELPADQFAAVVFEPILGEGGVVVPPDDFFRRLESICRRHGILMIADEVQTGVSRTGPFCASSHFGVQPDLIAFAKSLGFGIPIGAICGRAEIVDSLSPGGVGGTTGGNPLGCRTALAGIEILDEERIPERVEQLGQQLRARLNRLKDACPLVGDVRGKGLMNGIELVRDKSTKEPAVDECQAIVETCREQGVLVLAGGPHRNLLRLLPPLTIDHDAMMQALDVIETSVLQAYTAH